MSNNDIDYTPDFEVSENNTSQITSVHSEILDDNDDDDGESQSQSGFEKSISEDDQKGPSFTNKQAEGQPNSQSAQPQQQQQQSTTLTAEHIQKTSSQELDEIEDIIRKLERLEKAQSILEDALSLDEIAGNESGEDRHHQLHHHNRHELTDVSEKSERSRSQDDSYHNFHQRHNKSSHSQASNHSNRSHSNSKSKSQKTSATTSGTNSTDSSDTEMESRAGEDMSDAINAGIESIRKLIEKDLNNSQGLDVEIPVTKVTAKEDHDGNGGDNDEEQPVSDRAKDGPASVGSNSNKSESQQNSSASTSQKLKSQSRRTVSKTVSKPFDGSGDHHGGKVKPNSILNESRILSSQDEQYKNTQQQLRNEIIRQETLIQAYQNENEKLYVQLKVKEDEIRAKEEKSLEEINELKTQIATLKLSRLVPGGTTAVGNGGSNSSPRLGSAHKGEFDRLNDELTVKSLMIVELRKEIALLKMENKPARPSIGKNVAKIPPLSIDKEKEYQDTIRGLQKQVRTLQRILYSKDTSSNVNNNNNASNAVQTSSARNPRDSLASKGRSMSGNSWRMNAPKKATSSPNIDSEAIRKLEDKLEKERVDFQQQLSSKQHHLEEKDLQINALKIELARYKNQVDGGGDTQNNKNISNNRGGSEGSTNTNNEQLIEQLESRLSAQSDIIRNLKDQAKSFENVEQERNSLRQEVANYESRVKELQRKVTRAETLAKPSFRAGSSTKLEPVRPTMNQEKEKEYQKQVLNLQKQVRTLQKILYSKEPGSGPSAVDQSQRPKSGGKDLAKKPTTTTSAPPRPSYASNSATQILQNTLENERSEFEHLLEQKQRQLDDKDRQIKELKGKLSATIEENAWISSESSADKATYEEFRTKLLTQNKIIDSLKARLASYSNTEAEKCLLRKEINHYEFKVQDLQRKLARAESLARPENEVLAGLTEKVEDLHTRYEYRERQLDVLLGSLSLKTGHPNPLLRTDILSPRLMPSTNSYQNITSSLHNTSQSNNNNLNMNNYNGSLFNDDISGLYRGSSNQHQRGSLDLGELSPSALHHLIPHRDVPEI